MRMQSRSSFFLLTLILGCSPSTFSAEPPDRHNQAIEGQVDGGPEAEEGAEVCEDGFADCNERRGCETDITRVQDCGFCGNDCRHVVAHATATCVDRGCGFTACDPGFRDCDGAPSNGCETDIMADDDHCGGCGISCTDGAAGVLGECVGGVCTPSACETGYASCDGELVTGCETELTSDVRHCGSCGNDCNDLEHAEPRCDLGACHIDRCDTGFGDCDERDVNGCEVNLDEEFRNCGACDHDCRDHILNATPVCVVGSCDYSECQTGFIDCDADRANGCEVDGRSDDAHCGGCGHICAPDEQCRSGACVDIECPGSFEDCNGDWSDRCEADLRADPAHCGACGSVCALDNATSRCRRGACRIATCDAGFSDCDGDPSNGCEVELGSDEHCASCGDGCDDAFSDASAICAPSDDSTVGHCAFVACDPYYGDCDERLRNGCEADFREDIRNCGGCGIICGAHEECLDGLCEPETCPGTRSECDHDASTYCETNLSNDELHCGACGNRCALPHAESTCRRGGCAIRRCVEGWADCDGRDENGCETELGTGDNCGACGDTCAGDFDHAAGACEDYTCTMTACDATFADCDGRDRNGCETQLGTAEACGGCGVSCDFERAVAWCVDGGCALGTCDAGYGNCDALDENGCESDLRRDEANCGACGNNCSFANATSTCRRGTCDLGSCERHWTNADRDPANGCELAINTLTDCGRAGRACVPPSSNVSSVSCDTGSCEIAICLPGRYDCNGRFRDGCEETGLANNDRHCGACGNRCPRGESCSDGVCS